MDVKKSGSLRCGVCNDGSEFAGTEGLGTHLKNCHDPLQCYPCGQLQCGKYFINKTSMIRHITTAHGELFHLPGPSCSRSRPQPLSTVPSCNDSDDDTFSVCFEDQETAAQPQAAEQVSLQEQLDNAAVQLLLDMRSKASLTGKAIERFETGCNDMVQQLCGSIKGMLASRLEEIGLTQDVASGVLKDIGELKDPFENLKTIEQQLDFFSQKFGLVKPVKKYLDDRYDKRLDPQSNSYVQTQVAESYQYIPIVETLKLILSNKKHRERILEDYASKDRVLRSFLDGSKCKEHPLLNKYKNVLSILLFYDELEIANALGSKTIIHKLACFFFQILNLPPEAASELSSIHLLALAHADDLKKPNAFNLVLKSFCRDMKRLASDDGITIEVDGKPFVLRAILAAVTADTLAAHDLLGFLGVGATYFCRSCLVSRPMVRADGNAVGDPRTPDLHTYHLERVKQNKKFSSQCGVKRECPLNDIPFFHCVENDVFDAFHDLLEGIVPLVIKLVLRHFIYNKKLFTCKEFNARVAAFDYGFPDSKNKPSANFTIEMLTKAKGKLKQTGSQMWCLVRALPLILGDWVEEGNPHLQLIFLLQDIMQIIFSFEIPPENIERLETLVFNHNSLFKILFIDRPQEGEEEVDDEFFVEEEGLGEAEEQDNDNARTGDEERQDGNNAGAGGEEEQQDINNPGTGGEEELQGENNAGRIKAFNVYVTNKLHHLTHYADMIRKCGPPVRLWCAKFEGRMKIFRQHSSVCCNFKNPPQTMAQMFQLSNLKNIISESVERSIDYQKGRSIRLCEFTHAELLLNAGFTGNEELILTRSATLNGEDYRSGLFVCLSGSSSSRPSFALISEVAVVDKKSVYLLVKPWGNGGVSARYNAWNVFPLENQDSLAIDALSLTNFRCIAPWAVGAHSDIFLSPRTIAL